MHGVPQTIAIETTRHEFQDHLQAFISLLGICWKVTCVLLTQAAARKHIDHVYKPRSPENLESQCRRVFYFLAWGNARGNALVTEACWLRSAELSLLFVALDMVIHLACCYGL